MRLLLRPWVKAMLLGGQTTEFYMHEYLPFLSIVPRIALVTAFRLFANLKPYPSQMRLARLMVCFEEEKVAGRLGRGLLHCSQPSHIKFQHAVTMLCACHGRSLSIGPIWLRQASHGWGQKWSGWNRTNWTGGYGPDHISKQNVAKLCLWQDLKLHMWRCIDFFFLIQVWTAPKAVHKAHTVLNSSDLP